MVGNPEGKVHLYDVNIFTFGDILNNHKQRTLKILFNNCMENQRTSSSGSILRSLFTPLIIIICVALGIVVYQFVLGNPANFEGNNIENHPKKGNFYGIVYKGGFIVPILMAIVLIIVTVTIERLFTIIKICSSIKWY
jgi:uncharacterized protein (DUF486 family)